MRSSWQNCIARKSGAISWRQLSVLRGPLPPPPLPSRSTHPHHSLAVTQHPCIHLSDTRRRPNQSIILLTTASSPVCKASEAILSLRSRHGRDLTDLQGPSGGRASDALDSLGKPAGWPTAPTTWRPALGTLPIDPAHFSLALLLCPLVLAAPDSQSSGLVTVPAAVEQSKAGKDGEGLLQDPGHRNWHLGEIAHGKGQGRTGGQSIGHDTA